MTYRRLVLYAVLIPGLIQWTDETVMAEAVLFEDFADGNIRDGDPARWVFGGGDRYEIDDIGLGVTSDDFARAGVQRLNLTDISVRTRVSVIEGGIVGIASRWTPGGASGSNYYASIGTGQSVMGVGGIGGKGQMLAGGDAGDTLLEDVMLQLDVIGNQIEFWAWPPEDMMPAEPLLSAPHDAIESGDFYVWAGGSFSTQPKGPVDLRIQYVDVADRHITTGDLNHDGRLDHADLDSVAAAIISGDSSLRYDVNRDLVIDRRDHKFWIKEVKRTFIGDTNLDGKFTSNDLTIAFGAGEYEDAILANSNWSTGDWNGDAEFNSNDLVTALADGGYEAGPRPAAVPEPSAVVLLLIGAAMLCPRRR